MLWIKIKGINLGWFLLYLGLFQGIFQGISGKNITHVRLNTGQSYLNKIIQEFISRHDWPKRFWNIHTWYLLIVDVMYAEKLAIRQPGKVRVLNRSGQWVQAGVGKKVSLQREAQFQTRLTIDGLRGIIWLWIIPHFSLQRQGREREEHHNFPMR